MTDRRADSLPLDREFSQDGLYQQIVVLSAQGCAHWAHVMADHALGVLLWPRDRGDHRRGIPYRVTQEIVERGVWRVTLCAQEQLPAGVGVATRDAVLRAQIASSAMEMSIGAADQVVQCGLFGEVIYL
jgi:hypothetical protein